MSVRVRFLDSSTCRGVKAGADPSAKLVVPATVQCLRSPTKRTPASSLPFEFGNVRLVHDDVPAAAARGVTGTPTTLPFLERIQASFGRHQLSDVRAHLDPAASAAARAMSAEAFTTGEHIAFARSPSLRTAAHEAAHVVQQRSGMRPAGGTGAAGDVFEQHADRVADAVVSGRTSEALLDTYAPSSASASASASAPAVVQRQPTEATDSPTPTASRGPSAAIYGTGRLIGSFAFGFQRRFPGATLYDRSSDTARAIRDEISLGRSRAASPSFRRLAGAAARSQAAPPEVDTTLRFQSAAESETVVITGPGGERVLSFRFGPESTLEDIDAAVRAILDAIEQLSTPRGPSSDRVA